MQYDKRPQKAKIQRINYDRTSASKAPGASASSDACDGSSNSTEVACRDSEHEAREKLEIESFISVKERNGKFVTISLKKFIKRLRDKRGALRTRKSERMLQESVNLKLDALANWLGINPQQLRNLFNSPEKGNASKLRNLMQSKRII